MIIRVVGEPAPQGSKRHVGKGVMVESSKKVKPWRAAVSAAVLEQTKRAERGIDGPVSMTLTFILKSPLSSSKKKLAMGPCRKPDLDKLLRSTLDGLTESGLLADDARVVRVLAEKRFAKEGEAIGAVIGVHTHYQGAA